VLNTIGLFLVTLVLAVVLIGLMLWIFFLRSRWDSRGAGFAEAPDLLLSSCSNVRAAAVPLGGFREPPTLLNVSLG
jgi:hypothetical protein